MYDYDRTKTAATYPTFFLRAFQAEVKKGASKAVAEVLRSVDIDSEDEDPKREEKAYEAAIKALKKDADSILDTMDLTDEIEKQLQEILERANRETVAPTVERCQVEIKGKDLEVKFRLWYGEADAENPDEWANEPGVDSFLKKALGDGCRAYSDSIESSDWGGGMFTFSVTVTKKGLDLAGLLERALGGEIKKAIAKEFSR